MYFTDQNIMQREESMELIFEVLEMQKRNKPTERTRKADEKKKGHLPIDHVYSQSYGH